jgi:hypothetical protein
MVSGLTLTSDSSEPPPQAVSNPTMSGKITTPKALELLLMLLGIDVLKSCKVRGILHTSLNILGLESKVIVFNDLGKMETFSYQLQHVLHRNSGSRNTGFPKVDFWVYLDSAWHTASSTLARIYPLAHQK